MGKLIIHGIELSPPVRAVFLTAKAIGIDFEFKPVNLFTSEHMSEEFGKMNPQRTVPTLEDDGKIMWDSHAIIMYLIDKYGKDDSLYPKDLYKRALINQRLFFDSGILYPPMESMVKDVISLKKPNAAPEKLDAVRKAYDLVEKFLDNNLYLVGNSLTVADFCCIATISSLQGIVPFEAEKYPNMTNWISRLSKLPYYEEANGQGAKNLGVFYNKELQELQELNK